MTLCRICEFDEVTDDPPEDGLTCFRCWSLLRSPDPYRRIATDTLRAEVESRDPQSPAEVADAFRTILKENPDLGGLARLRLRAELDPES